MPTKADIIASLQKDILRLQGFKSAIHGAPLDLAIGPLKQAFPNNTFPLGAVHEFIATGTEEIAASSAFIAGLVSPIIQTGGALAWIGSSRMIFPPSLKNFGIEPDNILFVELHKEKDILWAMEEALSCGALSAVIAELPEISFTASRRLQLAVEKTQVTGFLLRKNPRYLHPTACVTRWKISPLPSVAEDDLPGIGFPHWKVALQKVRNGRPGNWQLQWVEGMFRFDYPSTVIVQQPQRKTG